MEKSTRAKTHANPYAVTVQDDEDPRGEVDLTRLSGKHLVWTNRLSTAMHVGVLAAAVMAWVEIETIVVSGIVNSTLAVALLFVCRRQRWVSKTWVSWAILGFAMSCFLTIFLCEWSPSEAHRPVASAITVFAGILIATSLLWRESLPVTESSSQS